MARGEVGRVGVPIGHLGDMQDAVRRDPARADEHVDDDQRHGRVAARAVRRRCRRAGAPSGRRCAGTTQNDILKEFLSRGTHIFPPGPSMRLTTDLIDVDRVARCRRWNPINVCSYHLQEAGADPVLEVAFTLANAVAVLDAVRATGRIADADFPAWSGGSRSSATRASGSSRRSRKMRAFTRLWDRIARERYGVDGPRLRRFRYGVQVNSLGLTAEQPENNAYRILLEMLGGHVSKDARARAVQLPAWNEALGLPRAWDQQWSLRAAADPGVRDGPARARGPLRGLAGHGGADRAHRDGGVGRAPARAGHGRLGTEALGVHEGAAGRAAGRAAPRRSRTGARSWSGVNRFTQSEPSPLADGLMRASTPSNGSNSARSRNRRPEAVRWRARRDGRRVVRALDELRRAAADAERQPGGRLASGPPGPGVDHRGVGGRPAGVFGEFRAPTGLRRRVAPPARAGPEALANARAASTPPPAGSACGRFGC